MTFTMPSVVMLQEVNFAECLLVTLVTEPLNHPCFAKTTDLLLLQVIVSQSRLRCLQLALHEGNLYEHVLLVDDLIARLFLRQQFSPVTLNLDHLLEVVGISETFLSLVVLASIVQSSKSLSFTPSSPVSSEHPLDQDCCILSSLSPVTVFKIFDFLIPLGISVFLTQDFHASLSTTPDTLHPKGGYRALHGNNGLIAFNLVQQLQVLLIQGFNVFLCNSSSQDCFQFFIQIDLHFLF